MRQQIDTESKSVEFSRLVLSVDRKTISLMQLTKFTVAVQFNGRTGLWIFPEGYFLRGLNSRLSACGMQLNKKKEIMMYAEYMNKRKQNGFDVNIMKTWRGQLMRQHKKAKTFSGPQIDVETQPVAVGQRTISLMKLNDDTVSVQFNGRTGLWIAPQGYFLRVPDSRLSECGMQLNKRGEIMTYAEYLNRSQREQ